MTRKFTLFAAALATTLASAVPALAEPDNMLEITSRIVRYDDLDLNNARGRERLDTRMRTAINAVCGVWSARILAERALVEKCRDSARKQGEVKVAEAIRNAAARYAARAD